MEMLLTQGGKLGGLDNYASGRNSPLPVAAAFAWFF